MKKYIKKKSGPKLGFRTSDSFKGKTLATKKFQRAKFNPAAFKVQHKG